MVRKLLTYMILYGICAILLIPLKAAAESDGPAEYTVKATLLYKLSKFVKWPPEAFDKPDAPITLCIIGHDPFEEALNSIKGKRVQGRPFLIGKPSDILSAGGCHILFVSASEKENLSTVLSKLKNRFTLTVSEIEGFARQGGMINFIIAEKKIRLEVNLAVAKRAGLKISSRLLKLAKIINDNTR
ncbi:YfiR family protein [Desulfococcaceae bacterium HSG7]|nr:YfiR family protein [Desulfococcaceae bacterium HSG7]